MFSCRNLVPVCLMASLVGCSLTGGNAPIVQGPTSTTVYTVQSGDTLYSIARRYSLDPVQVARENNLTNPGMLSVGQKLKLNLTAGGASQSRPVQRTLVTSQTAPVSPGAPEEKAQTQPVKVSQTESAPKESSTPTPASTSSAMFQWPAKGKIVKPYGDSNKGVDIGGKEGDSVTAAADGQVLFVGSVRGYGDLVIIRHTGPYVTAYGHNKSIQVKQGQTVKKGQKISTIGKTDAEPARVHFEIRRDGKPIDPQSMLPAR